ncbi:MAG: GNAT family N-acetyltransferase [Actinomycetes bacterium]
MSDLDLRAEPYDGTAAQSLVAEVQQEYVERYGGPDETVLDPAEFVPPRGAFFVGYLGGVAVVCGGWRSLPDWPQTAEIKRMYVTPAYRRQGLARLLLTHLEESARAAGHDRIWLETGLNQPEAMELYRSTGYQPIDGYGHYKDAPLARPMGKDLRAQPFAAGGVS